MDRQDSSIKSCLDIGIISVSLLPYLTKVQVDINRNFTPRRVIKTKKKTTTIFSDHYALKVELKGIPRKHDNDKPKPTWNRGKPWGWEVYELEVALGIPKKKNYPRATLVQKFILVQESEIVYPSLN